MATSSKASSSPSAGRSRRGLARRVRGAFVASMAVIALGACDNVLNDDDEDSFQSRLVNLIEDSPGVQYKIDTTVVSSTGYQTASALNSARPGSHAVSFQALRPQSLIKDDDTTPIDLGGAFERIFEKDRTYTIVAYGKLDNVQTLMLDQPKDPAAVADDRMEIAFANVAPNLPSVEVFITAPEAHIHSPESLGTLATGTLTSPRTLQLFQRADVTDRDAALFTDLKIELRDPATGEVLFNSATIRIGEQTRVLLAITKNIGPGPSTVQMMGIDGIGGIFTDINDRAALRVVHVSADTPALDILRASSTNESIAKNVAYRDRSPYTLVRDGEVALIAQPADPSTAVFLFFEEFSAAAGLSYSAYAVGPLATVDAEVLTDRRRSIPTQGSFRLFHAAPSGKGVDGFDVYVTLPDQALDFDSTDDDDTTDDAGQFRRATNLGYLNRLDYLTLKPGTYRIRMTPTGTSRVEIDTTIALEPGAVETYVLNDDLETGGYELIPVDDRA
jgi:hypothetical protein